MKRILAPRLLITEVNGTAEDKNFKDGDVLKCEGMILTKFLTLLFINYG